MLLSFIIELILPFRFSLITTTQQPYKNMDLKLNIHGVEIRRTKESELLITEEVTRESFWNHFQPGADEHYLLHQLRKSIDYIPELDLVAVLNEEIIGFNYFFSNLRFKLFYNKRFFRSHSLQ
jgi:hypothetical protein